VETTESGGVSGYDAGKKLKGRKRHIVTDTLGLMLFVLVHAADIQDRDGAVDLVKAIRHRFPWLRHLFADGGYAGDKLATALAELESWADGRSRSSSVPRPPRASSSCRGVGWSSAPSPGSAAAAASPRISSARSKARPPGPSSHTSAASPASSQGTVRQTELSRQTLSLLR
jgi:hypothetical protein